MRIIQFIQSVVQKRVLAAVLQSQKPLTVPWLVRVLFRIKWVTKIPAYILGIGICPARVED